MRDLAGDIRDYIDALVAPTDLDEVRASAPAIVSKRSWRRVLAIPTASVVLTALILGFVVLRGRDSASNVQSNDGVTGAGSRPAFLVASDQLDGRLAIYDVATGRRVRYLTDQQPGGGDGWPVASADGRDVYFTRGLGTCAAEIDRVDVSTGAVSTIVRNGDGTPPVSVASLSGDGSRIAYVTGSCDPGQPGSMNVRDLATGDEKRFPILDEAFPLALSPDGRHLAFGHHAQDGSGSGVSILDIDVATSIDQAMAVDVPTTCGSGGLVYESDAALLVATCGPDERGVVIAEFDPSSGARRRTVVEVPGIARAIELRRIESSSDGSALLYQAGSTLFSRSDDGAVAKIDVEAPTTAPDWLSG